MLHSTFLHYKLVILYLTSFFLLILSSCNSHTSLQEEYVDYPNDSFIVKIPVNNSCEFCQAVVGEWFYKNKNRLSIETVYFILFSEQKYYAKNYSQNFISWADNVEFIFDSRFLNSDNFEGSYPIFKIKVVAKNKNEIIEVSIDPGDEDHIVNQLESIFFI